MLTRRQLMKRGAIGGAGLMVARTGLAVGAPTKPQLNPFQQPLPIPPLARRSGQVVVNGATIDKFTITAGAGTHQFHPKLAPVVTWGYGYTGETAGDVLAPGYLGPAFNVQSGTPIAVEYFNGLPETHLLPVALTSPDGLGNPTGGREIVHSATPHLQTHLHGGFIAGVNDGNPYANGAARRGMWQPGGIPAGTPGMPNGGLYYPNEQPASLIWYHDHAHGMTRLNVYAGLAGAYFIRDGFDTGDEGALPGGLGRYEIPLIIQDKSFRLNAGVPELFYSAGTPGGSATNAWIPEFFGEEVLVNGAAEPFLDVEPRLYRFRILNGSNARFYNLEIVNANTNANGPRWTVIGSEGGMFDTPVPGVTRLLCMPAERFDVLVDFTGLEGQTLNLRSAPLPGGVVSPANRLSMVMQMRVGTTVTTLGPAMPASLPGSVPNLPAPARTRTITLNEVLDVNGAPVRALIDNKFFRGGLGDPHGDWDVTELPGQGEVEDWEFVNMTMDTHPIHLHLVQFQVMGRRPNGAPLAQETPARRFEIGWKDTVGADPGMTTRIRVKFDLPTGVSPTQEYVYHCHILEHEDNDMMRPYEVR